MGIYDDIIISPEAMEDIRQWGLSGLKDNMYQDTVDLTNVDPDKLKELDEFISKPRTYGKSLDDKHLEYISSGYKQHTI